MKKLYVIPQKNISGNGFRGVVYCFILYTCLKYWQVPQWVEITFFITYGISLLALIGKNVLQTPIDIFEDIEKSEEKQDSEKAKESFKEKLDRLHKTRVG